MSERKCLNCSTSYDEKYTYCPNCGQKNALLKVSVWQFIGTFLNLVFNLDSSFFQSLFGIFVPGKLTKDYFEGKRKKYAHPLRLFFIIAAIHISILGFYLNGRINENDDFIKQTIDLNQGNLQKVEIGLDSIMDKNVDEQSRKMIDSLKNTLKQPELLDPTDSLVQEINITDDSTSNKLNPGALGDTLKAKNFPFINDSIFISIFQIPSDTLRTLTLAQNIEKYQIEGFFYTTVLRQRIKMIKEPESFVRSLIANLIWMLFVLLPVVAIFMKLLYIRRKRYYVEHLVYLFHWHAFAFVIMSVFLLLRPWIAFGWILFIFSLIVLFGFLALKKYYKDGLFKAIIKYCIILFVYMMSIMVLFGAFALITSFIF